MKARLSQRGVSMVRFMLKNTEGAPVIVQHNGFSKMMTLAAMILSWTVNNSLCWSLLHGIFGGFYVVYWLIVHSNATQFISETFAK